MYNWIWKSLVLCLNKLAWRAYIKLRSKAIRLINAKDCAKITANQEYVEEVFGIKHGYKNR